MDARTAKMFNNLQFTQFVKDLGFNILSDKELNDPNPDFVQSLFIECLIRASNFRMDQLKNIPFGAATDLGSLEKHEAGISLIIIFEKIKELLLFVGIEDFTISDMLFPEPKRIKRIFAELSAFINYRNQETKNFESFLESNNESEVKLKKVQDDFENKRKEYDNLMEKKKKERDVFEKKSMEIEDISKSIRKCIEENHEKKTLIADLTLKTNETEDIIKKTEEEITTLRVQINLLKAEIVQSPEKLIQKKNDVLEEISKEKDLLNKKENDILINSFTHKILQSLLNKLTKQTAKFKELYNVLEAESNYKKEFSEKKMLLNSVKLKNESATAEANELIWNLKYLEDKSRSLDFELKKNLEKMTENLEKLRDERRREEIKDKELTQHYHTIQQKLQEISKKKQLNTPNPSSKKLAEDPRTIQKQPGPPLNVSESTPKEDFKDQSDGFQLITLRNEHHSAKESQSFCEFRVEIERRYKKSVMNKIYSFPRDEDCFSGNSSIDSLKSAEVYDLATQNYERRNYREMKNSANFGEKSNSQDRNPFFFDREIEKLTKEIEYYKKFSKDAKQEENQRQNHFQTNGPPREIEKIDAAKSREKERPHYIKLLNLLEENNDTDLRLKNPREGSASHSCVRNRDISSKKTPSRLKTEKTPCTFDRKIAKAFENCCEIDENLDLRIEASDFRSLSRGRRGGEDSRSKSKPKPIEKRVLSPVGQIYMNNYLYDKEFKQESIRKIYTNGSMLKHLEGSKERKNNFQEEEGKQPKNSKSKSKEKPKKPLRKLYLIQEKENLNARKKGEKKEEKPAAKKKYNTNLKG